MSDPANSNPPMTNEAITVNATANATALISMESASEHPMLAVLKTKKRTLKKLPERVILVEDLITDEIKSFLIETCVENDFINEVNKWWETYSPLKRVNKNKWSLPLNAKAMCEIDALLTHLFSSCAISDSVIPKAVQDFRDYMAGPVVVVKALIDADAVSKTGGGGRSKKRYGEQKSSKIAQDEVDVAKLTRDDYKTLPCPVCNHEFVYALTSSEEIKRKNDKMDEDYQKAKAEWNKQTASRRGNKPKPAKSDSNTLACMCVRINCHHRPTGVGCLDCKTACDNAKRINYGRNPTKRPLTDENFRCTCDICQCKCTALWKENDTAKLAAQTLLEHENRSTIAPQEEDGKCKYTHFIPSFHSLFLLTFFILYTN
jgi:hypothetical protein